MKRFVKMFRMVRLPAYKLFKSPTVQRFLAGMVFFLLFTSLLSTSLFVNRLDISVGEASPELILAPWPKVIEDKDKWNQEREAAAAKVADTITYDDTQIKSLVKDLADAFSALKSVQAEPQPDDKVKIAKLKGTIPFTALPDDILQSLIKSPLNNVTAAELDGSRMIENIAKDPKSGALNNVDVGPLKERIKTALNQQKITPELKTMLSTFVDLKLTSPTLRVDKEATEAAKNEARARVPVPKDSFTAGEKIVGRGEKVDDRIYNILREYALIQTFSPWKGTAGIALVVLTCMLSVILFLYHYRKDLLVKISSLVLLGLIMTLVLALGKGAIALNIGGNYNSLLGFLIPLAWGSMAIAILIDSQLSIVVTTILALFLGIMVDPQFRSQFGLQVALVTGFGGIAGVYSVSHLSQRSDLARAGLFVSAANVVGVVSVGIISGLTPKQLAVAAILGGINGIIASVFTVGTLHWFETGFKITSAVRLLELSNPNHPVLRKLLMEAPGTYHHSILVGNLAEAAAESVGADALMVRVGALYHDIGKLKRPYFFIENQFSSENPHDKIAPTLSTLIITSHIKDGLEMAREHKLPQPLQDIIEQHHANGLVTFFYHKAKEGEKPETISEAEFRYDAPKPQTKEAALVCLADSVEAAVRSLKEPSQGQIPGLVRKIIKDKLNDGQLDECNLTFRDLNTIAASFDRVLSGIFHNRVEYPEIKEFEGRRNRSAT
ncbi:MAG TPA: HDIG domain-containing protein [Verrucomicrobiae bacterium]|nr:HDIG domain-containing protein [Verrucomicrobiae bacterium]